MIRRPGMYGRLEVAEQLLLQAMAAVDGSSDRWQAEFEGLRERSAFTSTGVLGAYREVLPTGALRDATASVYAELARRLGWLRLDRAMSEAEDEQLAAAIDGWVTHDRVLPDVIDSFGTPSVWIGGTNPFYPKTLAYSTANPERGLVCVHLWNSFADQASGTSLRGVFPQPVVLAVRHRPGRFLDSFSFTPEGVRRRAALETQSQAGQTVWIFHGDRARYASAVFTTLDAGLAWATERQVTGILTEYANGGAYDCAVEDGRFTPTKPHHGTAEQVASFAPGLRHIHLTDGRQA